MTILRRIDPDYATRLDALMQRSAFDPNIEADVAQILHQVRTRGNEALIEFARRFDRVELTPATFRVPQEEIDAAGDRVDRRTRKAIQTAVRQVREFARNRLPKPWVFAPRQGVLAGERFAPLSRVGCYVPGGTAPLVSTVVHTAALAAAAGVPEIVVTTPPGPDAAIHPAILYAARKAGATEIYRLGGVYAIGALAFGTETIAKVEKIVGPGNAYVTAAKRQVYGYVALDLVAGPSEIMIIADDSADPRFIAADMLSQAEHGSGREQAVLVTTCAQLLDRVPAEIRAQAASLRRRECIEEVIGKGIFLIEAGDRQEAAAIASRYAPEHLEIMTRNAGALAKNITAAGAIFLGPWTPEPVGDFVAGPSHVLPTGGAARHFSGLTVEQFFRRMSVVHYQRNALLAECETLDRFAVEEGLDAHGNSIRVRLKHP
ncbi:MAG: histidinol dehydrogenase [Lentisphaeria bacterium]|nr:histidinol dehydrogenase [Lentisphaeria bacterium]